MSNCPQGGVSLQNNLMIEILMPQNSYELFEFYLSTSQSQIYKSCKSPEAKLDWIIQKIWCPAHSNCSSASVKAVMLQHKRPESQYRDSNFRKYGSDKSMMVFPVTISGRRRNISAELVFRSSGALLASKSY